MAAELLARHVETMPRRLGTAELHDVMDGLVGIASSAHVSRPDCPCVPNHKMALANIMALGATWLGEGRAHEQARWATGLVGSLDAFLSALARIGCICDVAHALQACAHPFGLTSGHHSRARHCMLAE